MKNVKNIIALAAAVILFNTAVNAQTVSTVNPEPLSVKYIGSEEGYLLFQVEVNTGANFSLFKINDKNEGELFSQGWKLLSRPQTFKIEKKDAQELSFTLLAGKKAYTKTFSTTTSSIETTTVSEAEVVKL